MTYKTTVMLHIVAFRRVAETNTDERLAIVAVPDQKSFLLHVLSQVLSQRPHSPWYDPEIAWTYTYQVGGTDEKPTPWVQAKWVPQALADYTYLPLIKNLSQEWERIEIARATVQGPLALELAPVPVYVGLGTHPQDAVIEYLKSNELRMLRRVLRLAPAADPAPVELLAPETLVNAFSGMAKLNKAQKEQTLSFIRTYVAATGQVLAAEQLQRAIDHIVEHSPKSDTVPAPADNPAVQEVNDRFAAMIGRAADTEGSEAEDVPAPLVHEMAYLNAVRQSLGRVSMIMSDYSKVAKLRSVVRELLGALDDDIGTRLLALTKFDSAIVPPHQGAGIAMLYRKLSLIEALFRNGEPGDRDYGLTLLRKTHDDFQRFLRDEPREPTVTDALALRHLEQLVEHTGALLLHINKFGSTPNHGSPAWLNFTKSVDEANAFLRELQERRAVKGTDAAPLTSTIPTSPDAAIAGPTT